MIFNMMNNDEQTERKRKKAIDAKIFSPTKL